MRILGTERLYFHTPEAHTNQYITKRPITFDSCSVEPKFARFEAISILHIMPAQRGSQGLAGLSHRSLSASQETDDPQLERQYGGFKTLRIWALLSTN